MNGIKLLTLSLFMVFVCIMPGFIVSCNRDSHKLQYLQRVNTNNETADVVLLFEHDGIKVYRFVDDGEYVYFIDCRGETKYSYQVQDGKTTKTVNKSIQTVK